MDDEQRTHLEELRETHQKRLNKLELREAQLGLSAPPELLTEIEDVREKVNAINIQLSTLQQLSDVQSVQKEQGDEIKFLRFFIANFIGPYELMHLEGLERGGEYLFHDTQASFVNELVHLRSSGLIFNYDGKGIRAMKEAGRGNLHDYFYITETGKEYLKLRRKSISESESTEAAKDT